MKSIGSVRQSTIDYIAKDHWENVTSKIIGSPSTKKQKVPKTTGNKPIPTRFNNEEARVERWK